jgi:hypothetical protein
MGENNTTVMIEMMSALGSVIEPASPGHSADGFDLLATCSNCHLPVGNAPQ